MLRTSSKICAFAKKLVVNNCYKFSALKSFSSNVDQQYDHDIWYQKQSTEYNQAIVDKFNSYYPEISNEIVQRIIDNSTEETGEYAAGLIKYMSHGGKFSRARLIIDLFNVLAPDHVKTEENIKLSYYLGWLIEIMNGSLFIADDIMDRATLRRNRLCWHLREHVGTSSLVHSYLLKSCVYPLLWKHFENHPNQKELICHFQDYFYFSNLGLVLEGLVIKKKVWEFNWELYTKLLYLKASYNTTYSTLVMAATLACNPCPEVLEKLKPLLLDFGTFYQYQNDYEDFFQKPKETGKDSLDIRRNICTWLAVRTMDIGSEAQKQTMRECYGKDDTECVEKVKQIYLDLKHKEFYDEYKISVLKNAADQLVEFSGQIPQKVLSIFLNHNYYIRW